MLYFLFCCYLLLLSFPVHLECVMGYFCVDAGVAGVGGCYDQTIKPPMVNHRRQNDGDTDVKRGNETCEQRRHASAYVNTARTLSYIGEQSFRRWLYVARTKLRGVGVAPSRHRTGKAEAHVDKEGSDSRRAQIADLHHFTARRAPASSKWRHGRQRAVALRIATGCPAGTAGRHRAWQPTPARRRADEAKVRCPWAAYELAQLVITDVS